MKSPLISVVIPTRNRAEFVVRAVHSALSQSMEDVEVIVVDDGSTDGTAEAIAGVQDRRLRLEVLPVAVGAGGARNVGIHRAQGFYVAFLDSDDEWHRDKLARQYEYSRSQVLNEFVCYTQVWQVNESSRRIVPHRGIEGGESVAKYLFEAGGMMQTSSLFMESALAKRVLFDPTLKRHQDYDLCLRLESAGAGFKMVEEPLVTWHVGNGHERLSSSVDVEASFSWLRTVGSDWRSKTRLGFLLREVVPRYAQADRRRAYTAWLAVRGAIHGLMRPGQALRMIARVPFPRTMRARARAVARRVGQGD